MIKKIIKNFLKKNYIDNKITMQERVIPWFKDNGDKTHRLNYELSKDSIVFDVGGYHGDWAADIFCKYGCYLYVFEPVQSFAELIKQRFSDNEKIYSYNFGLAGKDETIDITLNEDSSSTIKSSAKTETVSLVEAIKFIQESNIESIDLIKINIEGGEYALLEHLIEANFISKIKNIQVQFHDFVPDAEKKMKYIQQKLNRTHHLTYQYEFVWENWCLNV